MQHQLTFGSRQIDFTLYYKERKSLTIRVHPDATVEVIAPLHTNDQTVLEKIRKKAPWILKQIDHFNSYKPGTPARRFINGETHLYLGRQYRLKVVADTNDVIKAYRGQLWIHARNLTPMALEQQLNIWYREKATRVFHELLQEVLPKFTKYKVASPQLLVRTLSKRWGSCTLSNKIILNIDLIKAPKSCIEYVLVHELCHLIHHNHTKAFQNLLSSIIPDWEERKKRLEYMLV
ncbi:M48 family metallopeptidase [Xanthocytophaga flava]|uniref:M48 family metallopeptidase n=1 Tax=Xanthocytophaga flava TaxID=3048013 RepID=UPI0028D15ACD|nr:SprT family zinc-dependent metalloprotease [Xanthocytophaga flavus]MDJ1472437.1 SprT family zinc-dependent metalloprotease [Xanthocytophaga flavus]